MLIIALAAVPNAAHATDGPHVWVDTRSQVIFGENGAITALRETWLFDPLYSSFILKDLAEDGTPAHAEALARLAKTMITAMAEFGYFVAATDDGRRVAFNKPLDYAMTINAEKRVVLSFTLPLAKPVRPTQEFAFQFDDPVFFVAFDDGQAPSTALTKAPAGCGFKIIPFSMSAAEPEAREGQIDKFRAYTVVSCPPVSEKRSP